MTCQTLLIGELKAQRQALGWSLTEVAQRCGIDEHFLSDWERGVGSPQLDEVDCWANALGLQLAVEPAADAQRRGLSVDWQNRRINVDGKPVRLTPMEWKALERLAQVPGEVVTHQDLFRHLYGDDRPYSAQSTAIRVLITKLRRLLPLRIDAQWGRGYVLGDIPASAPALADGNRGSLHEVRPVPRGAPPKPPAPAGQHRDRVLSVPMRQANPAEEFADRHEPAPRHPTGAAPVRFLPQRAEELQVIERFLAERGVTRCPDVATIEQAPLPTLVWDKAKRKWVRPSLS